ncbi:gpW protein [Marinospirillum celere]|uniref:GpW protein n=1 Tax=Marinospirillum celere TaxID=1122252 RepID=A0A1I1E6R8_9GAMM|nr:gpW family head-tail joining protein [Marinospirillum celere]SFB80613.1 gpW protein [Marinospirillum celere]
MKYTQEDLNRLNQARIDLATGQNVTQVRHSNGKTLTFNPANRDLLERMIAEAKRSLFPKRRRTRTRQVFTSKGL